MNLISKFLSASDITNLKVFASTAVFQSGRQETGYEKAAVDQDLFQDLKKRSLEALGVPLDTKHDCYLIRYPEGSCIPKHKDDAPFGLEHHRLNAMIQNCVWGGELWVDLELIKFRTSDAVVFRPDVLEHEVTEIMAGERLLWSVGVLKESK